MHSAKRQRITFGFLCALLLLTNLQAIAQSGKFELDEFDNFIKTLNRGDFKTEDTDFLFRTFKEKYSQEVLSTIDTDLNSFVEDTLKDSGYLDSAGIFLRQLGTLISDEQSKKIDEYVEKQLNRFQDKYRYDEKLSVLFADEAILSNLKSQFKTQLKSRFEAIKTSFRDELKRSFPYAADMVVKSHDSLNVDVELKIVEELKKIKILASTGRTAAAGVTLVLLRKAITKLILRVIGKKIAASIAGKILGKAIPIVGWVLTAYDLLTAERQLLTTFKDEYSKHFHSHDFQREIFDQSLKSFEDDAKETYKSSIEAFISSISVKESNRLTGLIIQSKSPDADAYFPNYDNNDRARNVIDTVVRVYGADPEWAKYKMSEKFEISQSIGLENENAFIGLLKTNRDKFYKACEQRVNIVRDLLTIKEEGIIRYCLEFSDPLPVFEDIAYLYDKLGSQMAGKLDFVKFLIDSKGIAELKRHNLPRESVLPLAENYQAIQELYKTNQDAGAFMFLVAAKDKEMFKVCMEILNKHRIPSIQQKIIKGINDLGLSKTKVILSSISTDALVSFFDVENYNGKVDKYGERIVVEFNSGGNRGLRGFEKVYEINGGYSVQFESDWKIAKDLLRNVDVEPEQISKGSIDLYRNMAWSYDIPILGPLVRVVVSYIIKGNNAFAVGIVFAVVIFLGFFTIKMYFFFFPRVVIGGGREGSGVSEAKMEPAQSEATVVVVRKPEISQSKEIRIRSEEKKDDNHNQ